MTEPKKRGRKRIGKEPLTDTEKKRRLRARKLFYVKAAKEHGCTPTTVVLDDMHLKAFEELYQKWGGSRLDELSRVVFTALKDYFENDVHKDLETPREEDWPTLCPTQLINVTASDLFRKWEKQQ